MLRVILLFFLSTHLKRKYLSNQLLKAKGQIRLAVLGLMISSIGPFNSRPLSGCLYLGNWEKTTRKLGRSVDE